MDRATDSIASGTDSTPSTASVPIPKRRPLRTYSKRDIANSGDEPAPKRKRIDGQPLKGPGTMEEPGSHPEKKQRAPIPSQDTAPKSARTSIMHYFRPATASSSQKAAASLSTAPSTAQCVSPPPSSPIAQEVKGKADITARLAAHNEAAPCGSDKPDNNVSLKAEADRPGNGDFPYADEVTESTHDGADGTDALGNEQETREVDGRHQGLREGSRSLLNVGSSRTRRKRQPAAKKQLTQTILDLGQKGGFVECKECCMLYNTLHEKDVKYHARQHAAIVQKASKGRGDC